MAIHDEITLSNHIFQTNLNTLKKILNHQKRNIA